MTETPTHTLRPQTLRPRLSLPCAIIIRLAFGLVFFWNILCALQFIIDPGSYTSGFELGGYAGEVAVRGLGVAFLMWNVTYPAFIAFPGRFWELGVIILIQQLVGLVGETAILVSLPTSSLVLSASVSRFMWFDALGFGLMGASLLWLLMSLRAHQSSLSPDLSPDEPIS